MRSRSSRSPGRLGIARTSFYWFFKDRSALLEALLEEWEAKNTGAFVDACSAYAETIAEAMLNLIVVFHDEALFEPQLDFAVRAWAHQSDGCRPACPAGRRGASCRDPGHVHRGSASRRARRMSARAPST